MPADVNKNTVSMPADVFFCWGGQLWNTPGMHHEPDQLTPKWMCRITHFRYTDVADGHYKKTLL